MSGDIQRGDTVRALYNGVPGPTVWRVERFELLPCGRRGDKIHVVLADPRGGGTYTLPVDQVECVSVALWELAS